MQVSRAVLILQQHQLSVDLFSPGGKLNRLDFTRKCSLLLYTNSFLQVTNKLIAYNASPSGLRASLIRDSLRFPFSYGTIPSASRSRHLKEFRIFRSVLTVIVNFLDTLPLLPDILHEMVFLSSFDNAARLELHNMVYQYDQYAWRRCPHFSYYTWSRMRVLFSFLFALKWWQYLPQKSAFSREQVTTQIYVSSFDICFAMLCCLEQFYSIISPRMQAESHTLFRLKGLPWYNFLYGSL